MTKSETLYKRNARGNIIRWHITELFDSTIMIEHGILDGNPHVEFINPTKVKVNEIDSRIKQKRKEGYKAIRDLYDNAPESFSLPVERRRYLDTYLPKYNTTDTGFVLPMLAKTLEDNKPFEKIGTMLGQWKINGLRCIVGAKVSKDIFNPIQLTYTSREGTSWNLNWMDEILLKQINIDLQEMMVEEGVCLDGELYLPGYSVNEINSIVKNPTLPQHKKLQYWCYDLCIDNMSAKNRTQTLTNQISVDCFHVYVKESHLNNTQQFVLLPTFDVSDIIDATELRNNFIDLGFEGLIVRNPDAEYAFGKRNSSMFKFKKKEDGKFKIVDIKPDKRGLPIYTLLNDINDEQFDCTINIPQNAQKAQLEVKNFLIGKLALVEYRERSGVKEVPFHAKIVKVYV